VAAPRDFREKEGDPVTPPTPRIPGEDVPIRERVLDAAERISLRHGPGGRTIEAVAREAGVSKGGVLYHFPSKAAIIEAMIDRWVRQCEDAQAQAVARDGQRRGAFTRAYVHVRTRSGYPKDPLRYTGVLAAVRNDPQQLRALRAKVAEWQRQLEADGIDPVTATIVRLAIDGLCLNRLLDLPLPDPAMCAAIIDRLVEMTREGAERPEA